MMRLARGMGLMRMMLGVRMRSGGLVVCMGMRGLIVERRVTLMIMSATR